MTGATSHMRLRWAKELAFTMKINKLLIILLFLVFPFEILNSHKNILNEFYYPKYKKNRVTLTDKLFKDNVRIIDLTISKNKNKSYRPKTSVKIEGGIQLHYTKPSKSFKEMINTHIKYYTAFSFISVIYPKGNYINLTYSTVSLDKSFNITMLKIQCDDIFYKLSKIKKESIRKVLREKYIYLEYKYKFPIKILKKILNSKIVRIHTFNKTKKNKNILFNKNDILYLKNFFMLH